jgi:regulator of protease activity HflC (stomatin/prohibitin superfamily)
MTGFISDLVEHLKAIQFCTVIYKSEEGVMTRFGQVVPATKRFSQLELEEIVALEQNLAQDYKKTGVLPQDAYVDLRGKIRSTKRKKKSEILSPGIYFYVPMVSQVRKAFVKTQYADANTTYFFPSDIDNGYSIGVDMQMQFEITDVKKALFGVENYQTDYPKFIVDRLTEKGRDYKTIDWSSSQKLDEISHYLIATANRGDPKQKWGIRTNHITFTSITKGLSVRLDHQGYIANMGSQTIQL